MSAAGNNVAQREVASCNCNSSSRVCYKTLQPGRCDSRDSAGNYLIVRKRQTEGGFGKGERK